MNSKAAKEHVLLTCRWQDCGFAPTLSLSTYSKHALSHAEMEEHVCLWLDCDEEFEDALQLSRHLSHHAHHEYLLARGREFCAELNLQECQKERKAFKWACDAPSICYWDHCNVSFNDIVTFYAHIQWHCLNNSHGNSPRQTLKCLWEGCAAEVKTAYKLREHARVHSEEKIIGCPGCGLTFTSRGKLQDHLLRQEEKTPGIRCSHCFKTFSSERILRDHQRRHINYYRCNICNMTLASPAAIANHHKYRHQTERPFKCTKAGCSYAGKREHDFVRHLATHSSNKSLRCPVEGCDKKFRSKDRVGRHISLVHERRDKRKYVCHLCGGKWTRGANLTKHLVKQHQIYVPECYNRYSYVRGEDGMYRMQLVRFEAVADEGVEVAAAAATAVVIEPPMVKRSPGADFTEAFEHDRDAEDEDPLTVDESRDEASRSLPRGSTDRSPAQKSDAGVRDPGVLGPVDSENDVEVYVEDGEVMVIHSRPLKPGDEFAFLVRAPGSGGGNIVRFVPPDL